MTTVENDIIAVKVAVEMVKLFDVYPDEVLRIYSKLFNGDKYTKQAPSLIYDRVRFIGYVLVDLKSNVGQLDFREKLDILKRNM